MAALDVAAVPNEHLLAVLRAQSRQAAHEAARLLAVIAEVGRANPDVEGAADRLDHPHRYCADEIRAALSWTRRAADAAVLGREQPTRSTTSDLAPLARGARR